MRASKGFTLLELALTMALSAVLLTAFFTASRGLMQGMLMAADGVRGPTEAGSAMDQMIYDLEQATSVTATSSYSIVFQTPNGTIGYRLYTTDTSSRDTILERAVNGASASIGPRRALANFNPYDTVLYLYNSATTSSSVPLFSFNQATPGQGPQVDIYMVLQPNQTAPITYMRTKALCNVMTSW